MHQAPEPEAKRVLIIDDDDRLLTGVQDLLRTNGYAPRGLLNGKAAVEAISLHQPDIILLDVMMPGEDGFSVLRRIRNVSPVPVIMLTARGDDTDRIIGLELGADDYLPKPFNPRELLARIKAVLRRGETAAPPFLPSPREQAEDMPPRPRAGAYAGESIRLGGYELDTKQQIISLGKKHASLSTAEFCILHAFMTNPGKVLGREELHMLSFGRSTSASSRSIDVHVSRIRAILKRLGEKSIRIRTVWGSGYRWVEDE